MNTIDRRGFLQRAAGLAAGAATLASSGSAANEHKDNRPNIIVIMADDLSARELSCYGHPEHQTPVLDEMAADGVRFRTCWATPICSPSRAAIMTGRYGFRTQWFHNNLKKHKPLCEYNMTIGEVMRDAGYATAVTGKWQLPGLTANYGFDEHCMWLSGHQRAREFRRAFDGPVEKKGHSLPGRMARYWHPAILHNGELMDTSDDDYGPDIFVDFIDDFMTRHKGRPMFVYYPMCLPHKTWDFTRNRAGYVAPPALDENGRKVGGRGEAGLQSNVEYIDHLMGRVLGNLENAGLRDNTIVFFTCDNGTSGYGKGHIDMEKGPRVPMIVNGPGIVQSRGATEELTDFSDVLATVAELGEAELPEDYVIDGHSFAPLLRGEPFAGRDWIFSCYAIHRMLRDDRWLLDGRGRFYDCDDRRDETGYEDVTESDEAKVVEARDRFEVILRDLPAPPDEMQQQWREYKAKKQAQRRKRRQQKQKGQ